MHFKYLFCHACHPWHCKNYMTHSLDYEIVKAMQKFPGVLLHMLRDYTTVKEGLVANGNCLRDSYIVAPTDQNIFGDGIHMYMAITYHFVIIM